MPKLKHLYKTIRCYGLSSLAFRLRYEALLRSGFLKNRFPQYQESDRPLGYWLKGGMPSSPQQYLQYRRTLEKPRFFFSAEDLKQFECFQKEKVIEQADQILKGRLTWFSHIQTDVGTVPNWHQNPFTGQSSQPDKHWLDLRDFSADQGDIKFIWEPSRFSWVYPLVRAYMATGDEKYADHFWGWLENWLEKNPPNTGVNYKCGQECAIRSLTLCFAFYAFLDCHVTTPERLSKLACMLACHAERIEKNIHYARYQNNNHAVSEAAGLYTVGLLFPEFKKAQTWSRIGKKVLEECARQQIFSDGAYIQHSMNYHRLMLSTYLWVLRLSELNEDPVSSTLNERLSVSTEFLCQLQDPVSGRVPNYGANDGALLFSLDDCDYLDYRPVLGAMRYFFNRERAYPSGPWDEGLQWFFGTELSQTPVNKPDLVCSTYDAGGYYSIRQKDSWAMIRCHSYKTRPGHADMLHLDLWTEGRNILRDSGTFGYNCAQPWQDFFSSTRSHNCPVIDGSDQMTRGTRFMWFDWVRSKVIFNARDNDNSVRFFQGRHFGYCQQGRDIIHQRSVLAANGLGWLVIDDILGSGMHEVMLPWQLSQELWVLEGNSVVLPNTVRIKVSSDKGTLEYTLEQGNDKLPAGWQSLYYGHKDPSPVFIARGSWNLPVRFISGVWLCSDWDDFSCQNNNVTWLDKEARGIGRALLEPLTTKELPVLKQLSIAGKAIHLS